MRLSLADDDFVEAQSDAAPASSDRRPTFARGEVLALALALRFQAANNATMSARDLDAALSRLSTRHLQALLSLERHSRPMTRPSSPPTD